MPGTERAYIACQGCLKATIGAFWQMMWEQNCRIICMVTRTEERGKNKCATYWPTTDKPVMHGNCVIELGRFAPLSA